MKHAWLLALLVACGDAGFDSYDTGSAGGAAPSLPAAMVRAVAERDVGVDVEGVQQSTNVNCVDNGNQVVLRLATTEMVVACGLAMAHTQGLYACHETGTAAHPRAQCDLGFGQGPTPLIALCDQSGTSTVLLRNPPGGKLAIQKICQISDPTVPFEAYYGERKNAQGASFFPITKGVGYGSACGGCADQTSILSYSSSTPNQTVYYAY